MSDYFSDMMGMIWVQPDGPNTRPYPLFCHDLTDIDEPQGDAMTVLCLGANSDWSTVHRSQGAPSAPTFTVETWLAKTRGWLQKQAEKRCPLPVYVHWTECPPSDVFLNYESGQSLRDAVITNKSKGDNVKRRAEEGDTATMVGQTYELTPTWPAPEYWKLVLTNHTIAEAEPLRGLAFCPTVRCGGVCGEASEVCESGIITADNTGAAKADAWLTANGWVSGAAAATQPFAVSEAATGAVCIQLDKDTYRHIIACGTTAPAGKARIGYSDNGGATWTVVNVGTTNAEFFPHGGCLFALDRYHIWACSDMGNIFFSEDAGLTWTDQGAPVPGGGAEALMCIRFADANYGMCAGGTAGASSVFLYTTDGGAHWTLGAGPTAEILTGVSVIDNLHAWVTNADGELYYCNDFGVGGATSWTQRLLPTTPTKLGDVHFIDRYAGVVGGYVTVPAADLYPTLWRTFDGGYSWEEHRNGTKLDAVIEKYGINSVHMCDINHAFGVGEPVSSAGVIMELSAKGSV